MEKRILKEAFVCANCDSDSEGRLTRTDEKRTECAHFVVVQAKKERPTALLLAGLRMRIAKIVAVGVLAVPLSFFVRNADAKTWTIWGVFVAAFAAFATAYNLSVRGWVKEGEEQEKQIQETQRLLDLAKKRRRGEV